MKAVSGVDTNEVVARYIAVWEDMKEYLEDKGFSFTFEGVDAEKDNYTHANILVQSPNGVWFAATNLREVEVWAHGVLAGLEKAE